MSDELEQKTLFETGTVTSSLTGSESNSGKEDASPSVKSEDDTEGARRPVYDHSWDSCPWCLSPSSQFEYLGSDGPGEIGCGYCEAIIPIRTDWFRRGEKVVC